MCNEAVTRRWSDAGQSGSQSAWTVCERSWIAPKPVGKPPVAAPMPSGSSCGGRRRRRTRCDRRRPTGRRGDWRGSGPRGGGSERCREAASDNRRLRTSRVPKRGRGAIPLTPDGRGMMPPGGRGAQRPDASRVQGGTMERNRPERRGFDHASEPWTGKRGEKCKISRQ